METNLGEIVAVITTTSERRAFLWEIQGVVDLKSKEVRGGGALAENEEGEGKDDGSTKWAVKAMVG